MFYKTLRLILVLMVISMVSALVLTASFSVTEPRIEANRTARQKENIEAVLPEALTFQERVEEHIEIFEGYCEDGDLIGLAVNRVGPGFQGPISLIIGIDSATLTITGVRVQEMAETPGLGARITEDWFLDQFKGSDLDSSSLEYDIIAGATVSADAVAEIIEKSLEAIKDIYGEGGE